jgi:hypothetical protein
MARVELLFFDGCPNHEELEPRLRGLLERRWPGTELELRLVESDEDAQQIRFLGSPSVRVDGRDVEPGAKTRADFGLKCRLYQVDGRLAGTPPDAWIVDALDDGLARLRTRSALNRVAHVSDAARVLHRRILLALASGAAPTHDDPGSTSAPMARHPRLTLWCGCAPSARARAATACVRTLSFSRDDPRPRTRRSSHCRPPSPSVATSSARC